MKVELTDADRQYLRQLQKQRRDEEGYQVLEEDRQPYVSPSALAAQTELDQLRTLRAQLAQRLPHYWKWMLSLASPMRSPTWPMVSQLPLTCKQ